MDDRDLYQTILGLHAPWGVERVEVSELKETVYVWVGALPGTDLKCPECGEISSAYDHSERRWRHLDTCQYTTVLCARLPRVSRSAHCVFRPSRPPIPD